jgi:ketosteroid isomerase-like protein
MRQKALSIFVISVAFASLALAQAKSAEQKSAPVATGIPDKALIQKVLDAWSSMDTSIVGKYYDQAPTNVFYDVDPIKYVGWSQYDSGVKQVYANLKSIKFTANDDATVHRSGNFAWGTATVKTEIVDKTGKVTNLPCRWTIVWEKRKANWLIVHDHFSVPVEPPK